MLLNETYTIMTDLKRVCSVRSPFDSIRHYDENGKEFWYARELMPLLGYRKWERFNNAIVKAKASCGNAGNPIDKNFFPEEGKTNGRTKQDFKLTRYACHLIAMNGDPRKERIAQAQAYFVIRIYQAETQQQLQNQPSLNISPIELVEASAKIETINNATLQELLRNEMIDYLSVKQTNKLLPSKTKQHTIVKVRAKELGYSTREIGSGSQLGRYVAKHLKEVFTERVGKYPVKHYEVNDDLDTVIKQFFALKLIFEK